METGNCTFIPERFWVEEKNVNSEITGKRPEDIYIQEAEMDLGEAFGGKGQGSPDRILALTERLERIGRAIDRIRYDNELVTELPGVLKTLGDAKDAVIAELKTV